MLLSLFARRILTAYLYLRKKSGFLYIILYSIALGSVATYFPDLTLTCTIILVIAMIASFNIHIDPYNLVLILVCFLPLQNFIITLIGRSLRDFPVAIISLVAWKEILLFILLVYILLSGRMRLSRFVILDYIMLAYFLWTSFYLILPNDFFPFPARIRGRVMGYRAAVIPVALYFVGRFIPLTRKKLVSSVRLIIVVAIFVGLFGITERFFIPDSFWFKLGLSQLGAARTLRIDNVSFSQNGEGKLMGTFYGIYNGKRIRRSGSTYLNPLAFAFANIFVIPLVLYFVFVKGIRILKTPVRMAWVLLIVGISQILTVTRAAIVANIVAMGLFFVYLKGKRHLIAIFCLTLFLIILPFIFLLKGQLLPILRQTVTLSDPSSLGHVAAWSIATKNILTHPFGYGLGFGGYVGRTFEKRIGGESLYFTIFAERGFIGLSLFVLALITLVVFYHSNLKYLKEDSFLLGLGYVVFVATIGYALASLTTEHWQAFVSSGVYWVYAGIMIQVMNRAKKGESI